MNATSTVVRGVVLLISAALAMPLVTNGAGIIGGDDVPPCDTVSIGQQGCAVRIGVTGRGNCTDQKSQCLGCGMGTKTIKCGSFPASCDHSDCIANQREGINPGGTCITGGC